MVKKRLVSMWGTLFFCIVLLLGLLGTLLRWLVVVHAAAPVPHTVFLDTTPVIFSLTTVGASGTVSYTVKDLSDVQVTAGHAEAMAGHLVLMLPPEPDGYYTLEIVDATATSSVHQSIPFAIVAPAIPDATSSFGVGTHFAGGDSAGLSSLIAMTGVGSIRNDATWSQVEQGPGQYSFQQLDPYMETVQQNSLSPLLILDYTNRFYDNGQTPYDAAGFTAFANYAKAVVSHYGSQLKAVEVYNEYNGLFSTGPCARKAACYVQMLRAVYQAVKAVRPDITVVGGAAFYADLPWFSSVFQNGGLQYMDVVSDHPYTPLNVMSPEQAGIETQMRLLRNLIQFYNHGVAKPVWVTELGWPTTPLNVSERTQADYLVRGALLSLAAGVEKFFCYDFLNDGPSRWNGEHNFGLLRRPDQAGRYTPKPAYVAYAVLVRQLAHRSYQGSEPIGDDLYSRRFTDNMHILWSKHGNRDVTIAGSGMMTVTTMTGHVQHYTPTTGLLHLTLSEDPIYVQGAGITNIAG